MEPRRHLEAIAADLTDDRPRLVYADALAERGDPRGEFITVQCKLAHSTGAEAVALAKRSAALLERHRAEWQPPSPADAKVDWYFRRGFPSEVAAAASTLNTLGALEDVPTLEGVRITRLDRPVATLASWPVLRRLVGLTVHFVEPTERHETLDRLLDGALLPNLRRFGLAYTYLSATDWTQLASGPLLTQLTELHLPLSNATDAALEQLMARPLHLEALTVANNRIGTSGTAAIANAEHARHLRRLDLSWNRLGVRAARALGASPHLDALEHLDLSHCQLGDEGCQHLAEGARSLKHLRIGSSRVGAAGVRALLTLPSLEGLQLVPLAGTLDDETHARVEARFPGALSSARPSP